MDLFRFAPAVRRNASPDALIHWDALTPGFGLRISDKGARSWVAMYRVNGKSVMQTLGSLALIPKVDDARQRAREAIIAARSGINPVEEKRAAEAAMGSGAGDLRRRRRSLDA